MHDVGNDGGIVVGPGRLFRLVRVKVFVGGAFSLDQKLGQVNVAVGKEPNGTWFRTFLVINLLIKTGSVKTVKPTLFVVFIQHYFQFSQKHTINYQLLKDYHAVTLANLSFETT